MKKGMKKYTVEYMAQYFDGGRMYGSIILFAENEIKAREKFEAIHKNDDDEPRYFYGDIRKWQYPDKTECANYPYWGMDN